MNDVHGEKGNLSFVLGRVVCPRPDQSPVSPNSGSGIWHKILKHPTMGCQIAVTSYFICYPSSQILCHILNTEFGELDSGHSQ